MSRPGDNGAFRVLRFPSVDAMRDEVDRLARADFAGNLRQSGNWTLGQILNHLAAWVEYSFTQPPLRPPWFVKIFVRLFVGRKKFVAGPMPRGAKIPKTPGGTLDTERVPLEAGLARFNAAWDRLVREAPQKPNVLVGPLTHEEWISLHLRHTENHLGNVDAS